VQVTVSIGSARILYLSGILRTFPNGATDFNVSNGDFTVGGNGQNTVKIVGNALNTQGKPVLNGA
jgi:hypothetical protein